MKTSLTISSIGLNIFKLPSHVFKMLKIQDTNSTTCKTCKRLIKYSIKDNNISSFNTKNSDEQICCLKHLEHIQKYLETCKKPEIKK